MSDQHHRAASSCIHVRHRKRTIASATLVGLLLLAHTVGNNASAQLVYEKPNVKQVVPRFNVKKPPANATTTADGLSYVKEVEVANGASPSKNDTVTIHFICWLPSGETDFNTRMWSKPMQMALNTAAPGFAEAVALMKKGEKAYFWMPDAIAYRTSIKGYTRGDMVYEIELRDFVAAPPIPVDVAGPARNAMGLKKSKTDIASIELIPPKDPNSNAVREWDNAVFNYTSWDATGRMIESSEVRKNTTTAAPFKQPPGLGEALTGMRAGERKRFWIPPAMLRRLDDLPPGNVCYEIELISIDKQIDPPPVPKDVAKPPADAMKTEKGVAYKILTPGTGTAHPSRIDTVIANYTGWTTDGKLFDSSVISGKTAELKVDRLIKGWADGLEVMVAGEKVRFWIPDALAYKGETGKPQGMLVFDVELLEIKSE